MVTHNKYNSPIKRPFYVVRVSKRTRKIFKNFEIIRCEIRSPNMIRGIGVKKSLRSQASPLRTVPKYIFIHVIFLHFITTGPAL
jgi:hypothetical protein